MAQTDRELRIAAYGLLVAVGALAYLNTFDGDFVWDDASSVLLHRHVQLIADDSNLPLSDPAKFFQLFREDQHAFGLGQGNFYRPLVSASFTLDFLLSYNASPEGAVAEHGYPDISPLMFHVTNLAWHIAAALLLFLVLLRCGAPFPVGLCVGLLFVAHPLHTEAVSYISGRADMMSAAFMFAGLFFVLGKAGTHPSFKSVLLALICFCAALLSKESSTAFPLLLAVFALCRPALGVNGTGRAATMLRRSFPLAAAVAVLGVYVALRMTVLRFAESQESVSAPLANRLVEVGQALAAYLRLLFVPAHLHMEKTLHDAPAWTALIGFIFLGLLVSASIVAYRRDHWRIAAGFAWFLLTWLPISGVFPLNAPLAEHWMYVPMAGFWWGLAEIVYLGAARVPAVRYPACGATAALVLGFLCLTALRNQDWHDNATIYRATLAGNPASQRVHANLAATYKTETRNFAGARRHFEETLHLLDGTRSDSAAQFLNDTYFHASLATLLFGDIRFHESLDRTIRCLDALDAFAAIPMPSGAQVEDLPLKAVVAPLGQAFLYLMLGEFDRAESGFREAFIGTGDPGQANPLAASGANRTQADQMRAFANTASFRRAQAIFSSSMPHDVSVSRLVAALGPDALVWPHRPEPFWRRLLGVQSSGQPESS